MEEKNSRYKMYNWKTQKNYLKNLGSPEALEQARYH